MWKKETQNWTHEAAAKNSFLFFFGKQCQWSLRGLHSKYQRHFTLYCFMQLTSLSNTYAAWQILESKLHFYIEIPIQYYYWSSVETELQRIMWNGCIFSRLCPGHTCKTKPVLVSWKIWTSSGSSFLIFLSQQYHLHFSTEAGFEQRVWLLSLLVKCLKKTCNLNCCRAHQYEIGLVEGNKM